MPPPWAPANAAAPVDRALEFLWEKNMFVMGFTCKKEGEKHM